MIVGGKSVAGIRECTGECILGAATYLHATQERRTRQFKIRRKRRGMEYRGRRVAGLFVGTYVQNEREDCAEQRPDSERQLRCQVEKPLTPLPRPSRRAIELVLRRST